MPHSAFDVLRFTSWKSWSVFNCNKEFLLPKTKHTINKTTKTIMPLECGQHFQWTQHRQPWLFFWSNYWPHCLYYKPDWLVVLSRCFIYSIHCVQLKRTKPRTFQHPVALFSGQIGRNTLCTATLYTFTSRSRGLFTVIFQTELTTDTFQLLLYITTKPVGEPGFGHCFCLIQ